jgi:hypothetical protein
MQDVSHFLPSDPITALSPSSMAAGNMVSSNKFAMTAPGSDPVDPLPPAKDQGDPSINVSGPVIPPGTSGKPQASKQAGHVKPGTPAWGPTTVPNVVRET